ncbi:hypothetical protein ABW19_dt0210129 [Dactylella cylindrospora]|nr:hypothetical protein ABW19_dt0210129 [Dactylella cylindrospora]
MASNRPRQFAEITLLSTMYPKEFQWNSKIPLEDLIIGDDTHDIPSGGGKDIEDGQWEEEEEEELKFSLVLNHYPSSGRPVVYVTCGDKVNTKTRKEARSRVETIVKEECEGGSEDGEVLDVIIQKASEALNEISITNTNSSSSSSNRNAAEPTEERKLYKRTVIWTHHLLPTAKRKNIISWGAELGLVGYSRPGYPGGIFVEGGDADVDEFVERLKGLKWQALQVRGEERGSERLLKGGGVKEVEGFGEVVEGLGELEGCRRLFLEGMRIGVGG